MQKKKPAKSNKGRFFCFNSTASYTCLTPSEQYFTHIMASTGKLHFDEMMMMSALFYSNMLSWIFIVLVHLNNSPRVDMSLYSDILLQAYNDRYCSLINHCLIQTFVRSVKILIPNQSGVKTQ